MTRLTHLRWPKLGFTAALMASLLAGPAQAQLFGGDDEARQAILKLRQEVESLRTEGQRGRLHLANQIEAQQQQIMQMRGQIETLEKQVHDLQRSTGTSPSAGGGLPNFGNTLGTASAEQTAYDQAIEIFRRGEYAAAAQALAGFVQQYPTSTLVPNAEFYWGSSLYATKEFRSAIQRLEALVQTAPTHPRAADALLVIAGSQIELGERAAAKSTLQRIIQNYSDTPAASTARDRLQLLQ